MLTQAAVDVFAQHWLAAWNAHDLDQIMTHYEDHVELISPVVVQLLNQSERIFTLAALYLTDHKSAFF